jgi:hypothetical protein
VAALLRLSGRPSDTVPSLPVAVTDLARLAKRGADVPVPPPLPLTLESSSWSIAPEHDPDPEIAEAARAKIVAEAN